METNYTEGVAEVTQADRDDATDAQHDLCLQCNETVCKQGDDGQLLSPCLCNSCTEGEPVRDENEIIGYVHAACREQLLIEQLQQDVENALNIRLPLGLQLIGRALDEGTLFSLGAAVEKAANFRAKPQKWW